MLFADTFNRYFEPENLDAALAVLAAAGYAASICQAGGRPAALAAAAPSWRSVWSTRRGARPSAASRRSPLARRAGMAVVGLEPSCVLGFRDEIPALVKRAARRLAATRCCSRNSWRARRRRAGSTAAPAGGQARAAARPLPPEIVRRHGRGRGGAAAGAGLAVETVESSCCGMAGAFGYGADTIDVSLKMAELSLLPAVRKAEPDTLVVADGTSCRHQIKDGAGREALHVARVLAMSPSAKGTG